MPASDNRWRVYENLAFVNKLHMKTTKTYDVRVQVDVIEAREFRRV